MSTSTPIHRRIATRMSAVLVIIVASSAVFMGLTITSSGTELLLKAAKSQLAQENRLVAVRLQDILDDALRDIDIMANSPAVHDVVLAMNGDSGSTEQRQRTQQVRNRLQEVLMALIRHHPWYQQARLIGTAADGLEVVRVEQTEQGVVHVTGNDLQPMGDREYFMETLDAPPGKAYWSAIELNREQGKSARPVLRIAMPVEGHHGKPFGIVVLNLDIERVFKAVHAVLPSGITLYIANDQGDYIYHPEPDKTFGFEGGQRHLMQDDFGISSLPVGSGTVTLEEVVPAGANEPMVAHLSRLSMKTRVGDNLVLALTRPRAQILEDVNAARQKSIALIIPFIIFSVVVVVWLIQVFTGPLGRFTREVSRYRPGKQLKLPEQMRQDEVGHLAQAFVGMAERINQQVLQLEEQTERFHSLLDAVPDAVIIIDENGSVEFSNPAVEQMFGYSGEELRGRNVNVLMPEPDHSQHDQYLQRYLEGGEPHVIGIGRKVTGLHKNGQTLPLYLSVGEFRLHGRRKFTGILHGYVAAGG
jgi:two-component system sensor histidine kinase/response regulator